MQNTLRTFIAVETSGAIRTRALELMRKLQRAHADVKWVESHNLHLTLKFLGDTPATEIGAIVAAVRQAAASIEPFDIEIRGAGAFPDAHRPRTLWLGGGEGDDAMARLAEAVDAALDPLGFPRERRRFQTHLTIGRVRGGGPPLIQLGSLLAEESAFAAGHMQVDELVLFSSDLTREGPIYHELGHAELGA